ncbi:hypothetical protein [Glycomyces sp. NPDC048151]|uniref:hypothetical protein n=1 Tax=Glycomyces sp. NPDC048151 TaxID=3364002 RepID=UPI00372324F4
MEPTESERPSPAAPRGRRVALAAAAGPLAVLMTAAAAVASPAESTPEIQWEQVQVTGMGAQISLSDEHTVYRTGALKGTMDLALVAEDYAEADNMFLHKRASSPGHFGHVDAMIGPGGPVEGKHGPAPTLDFPTGVGFDVYKLPEPLPGLEAVAAESGGEPVVTLVSDPFVLEPVECGCAEEFPPVNQQYEIEDSMSLYYIDDEGAYVKVGVLERFDITVNRTP